MTSQPPRRDFFTCSYVISGLYSSARDKVEGRNHIPILRSGDTRQSVPFRTAVCRCPEEPLQLCLMSDCTVDTPMYQEFKEAYDSNMGGVLNYQLPVIAELRQNLIWVGGQVRVDASVQ